MSEIKAVRRKDSLLAAEGAVRLIERVWEACMDDGYGYLDQVPDRWGELCASPLLAGRWADDLAPGLRHSWKERGHLRGGSAALSCLLAAGHPAEVVELLELAHQPGRPRWCRARLRAHPPRPGAHR